MAVLGLHFCVRAFSSCGKRGIIFNLRKNNRAFKELSLKLILFMWTK